jgi:putative addiction module component (TIGR02574 family)
MKLDIDISQLSPAECILLAEQLWERARNHPEALPVTEAQMTELNQRLETLDAGTMEPGEPWDIVQERLWRQ